MKHRLTAFLLIVFVAGGALLARALYFQVFKDERVARLAQNQFQSRLLIRPRRGVIQDRNGEALAVNVEAKSLAANPLKIKNKKRIAKLLEQKIHAPAGKIFDKLNDKKGFVWVKRHLSEAESEQISRLQMVDPTGELAQAFWLVRESKRVYPQGRLAGNLLGSVNLDSEGIEGVEYWQNQKLSGKITSYNAIKDALGRPTFMDANAARQVQDGEEVKLSIDGSLQYAVESELKSAVEKTGSQSGMVVVMNAVTGEILSIALEPAFDPNDRTTAASARRLRPFTDGYEPGSTLKAVVLASALSNGMTLKDTLYGEKGSFTVQGRTISEAEAHEKFEWIDLKRMMQVSSNVGAAKLAMKLGPDKMLSTFKLLGIGARTEVGFPGEIAGRIPQRKAWTPLATANIGFGQGVLVTPMQMLKAYAAFLNGVWLVQPTLLKSQFVNPPRRVLSEAVANDVLESLLSVTQPEGTGTKAVLEGYRVAGKTGTAQVVDSETRRYSRKRFIGTFIGFAVDVEPKIAILTYLDGAKGVYYASETAAPLFKEILRVVVNRYGVPSNPQLLAQKVDSPPKILSDKIVQTLAMVKQQTQQEEKVQAKLIEAPEKTLMGRSIWTVPDLKGLSSREVIRIVQSHALKLEIQGEGFVLSQFPEAGQQVADGGTIKIHLNYADTP